MSKCNSFFLSTLLTVLILNRCLCNFFSNYIYIDIKAVVGGDLLIVAGGDLLTVASVIPEQSNLKKLWTNIKDLCFH